MFNVQGNSETQACQIRLLREYERVSSIRRIWIIPVVCVFQMNLDVREHRTRTRRSKPRGKLGIVHGTRLADGVQNRSPNERQRPRRGTCKTYYRHTT